MWSFCREANMVCYSETHLGCLKKFDFLSRKTSLMGKTEKLHIYIYIFRTYIHMCWICVIFSGLNIFSPAAHHPSSLSIPFLQKCLDIQHFWCKRHLDHHQLCLLCSAFHILRVACFLCLFLMWPCSRRYLMISTEFNGKVNITSNSIHLSIQFTISTQMKQSQVPH